MNKKDIVRIGDIFAIPCFALLTYYFLKKSSLTSIELFLLIFSSVGLIFDTVFTIDYLLK